MKSQHKAVYSQMQQQAEAIKEKMKEASPEERKALLQELKQLRQDLQCLSPFQVSWLQ